MINKTSKNTLRQRRHRRVRRNVAGSTERPRLVVFRSSRHIYAQVIDDLQGTTLVSASSLEASLKNEEISPKDMAKRVGELCAERAAEKGVTQVVFDRGGYKYHGRIAALAEGAREKGLDF